MKRGACLLLVALAVTAGCGGGPDRLSKSQYEGKLQSALRASARGASTGGLHDLAGAPGQLSRIADAFHGVATSLDGLRAPVDAQRLNGRLVHGAATVAKTLDELAAKLVAAPDLPTRERLLARFDPAHISGLAEFDGAARALVAKGYRLSWNAGT